METNISSKGAALSGIIRSRDLKPIDLARAMGVSAQTVNNWLKRGVSAEYALMAADYLICSPESISGIQPVRPAEPNENNGLEPVDRPLGKVPLISSIQAGAWCEAVDNFHLGDAEDWLPAPAKHGPHAHALRVIGTSMEPRFRESEIVVVDPEKPAVSGSFVVAKKIGSQEVTLKQLVIEAGESYLKALNPHWPDPIIRLTEEWAVCGSVICKIELF